mmetsp:Transcript_96813/g.202277  ORF Transcript_96813/g.202277 Transcript_96813/m.202277 type:complete len:207 (+) Transcript_96813:520-1140(+)
MLPAAVPSDDVGGITSSCVAIGSNAIALPPMFARTWHFPSSGHRFILLLPSSIIQYARVCPRVPALSTATPCGEFSSSSPAPASPATSPSMTWQFVPSIKQLSTRFSNAATKPTIAPSAPYSAAIPVQAPDTNELQSEGCPPSFCGHRSTLPRYVQAIMSEVADSVSTTKKNDRTSRQEPKLVELLVSMLYVAAPAGLEMKYWDTR